MVVGSAVGGPPGVAHAVCLPVERVVRWRFKGFSVALQGRFKGECLALVRLELGGDRPRGLDCPAQWDGGVEGGTREQAREDCGEGGDVFHLISLSV